MRMGKKLLQVARARRGWGCRGVMYSTTMVSALVLVLCDVQGVMTTGACRPLALWVVMMRTASMPSGMGTFSSWPCSFQ